MASGMARVRKIIQDPFELAQRLRIMCVPEDGATGGRRGWGRLELREEQEALAEALRRKNRVYVLKCRRVGTTTYSQAYLYAKSFGASRKRPRVTMSLGHADFSVETMRNMVSDFHAGMPDPLRFPLRPDNLRRTGFTHNGSMMLRDVAGGKGEGRSGGFTDLHFTEMAYYPRGTAARGKEAGQSDKEAYQALMSGLDDPMGKVIVESTGNGPRGHFYTLSKVARNSDEWEFLFFPWHRMRRYSRPFVKRTADGELVPDEAAASRFESELTEWEREMADKHSLSLSQLRWMRSKLSDDDYSLKRFLREYPFTPMDPFLLDDSGWFNQLSLQQHLSIALGDVGPAPLQVFIPYEEGRRYYMGVDTSGGVDRDEAVIQIVRDDWAHCLTWRSSTTAPYVQAQIISELGHAWGHPLCLVEANKHGLTVINHLRRLGGVSLYDDPDSQDGNFWMTGGRAGRTKSRVYDHAAEVIHSDWCTINHPETIMQLQAIIEKESGKIEADGGNDDLADAFVLALWCARRFRRREGSIVDLRAIHRARMERVRDFWGVGHRMAA